MSPNLPLYVDYGAVVSLPPPIVGKGGELLALVLDGNMEKLETWCENVLNSPAKGVVRYKPATSQVLLMAGSFAEMTSGAPKFRSSGSVAETQLALFLLLSAEKNEGGAFVDAGIRIAVPYIFVDNPMSYASGREDYGYPKAMGQFKPANGVGSPMEMKAFGGDLASNSKAGWTTLLELERVGQAGSAAGPPAAGPGAADEQEWRPMSEIAPYFLGTAEDATGVLGTGALLVELITALLDKSARQVFLKQFRDAQSSTAACYQAIVEAPLEVSNFSWRPTPQWTVKITPITSHPIATELGVAPQTTWKTLELHMDLRLDPGEVVAP
jgi:hypothetical protein